LRNKIGGFVNFHEFLLTLLHTFVNSALQRKKDVFRRNQRNSSYKAPVAIIVVSKLKLLIAGVFDATIKDRVTAKVVEGLTIWLV
jgi:uncharacterized membrane protein YiaA